MRSYRDSNLNELVRPGAPPRHVAIIMDGNGRWAKQRGLPRFAGHRAGVEAVRKIVSACAQHGVEVLTLFAFSSENWKRPATEVGLLMELFLTALKQEVKKLNRNNVKLQVIGEREGFSEKLQQRIRDAEELTKDNTGLVLVIAANYGGRWDIMNASRQIMYKVQAGELTIDQFDEALLTKHISVSHLPEPDLFIRTGGEKRISNFLLWQLAYTELFFTDALWPDFDEVLFGEAIASFANRQRRFGRTGEQIEKAAGA